MTTVKELFEKRASLATRIKEINEKHKDDEGRAIPFDAETEKNWKDLNADYDSTNMELEREQRLEKFDSDVQNQQQFDEQVLRAARPAYDGRAVKQEERKRVRETADASDQAEAFRAWCLTQLGGDIDETLMRSCKRAAVNPYAGHYDFDLMKTHELKQWRANTRDGRLYETREFQAGTDNLGGATVPAEDFVARIERSLLAFGGVRELADVIRTDRGVPLTFPTINDTGTTGQIEGESDAFAEDSTTPFGSTTITIYKYSSDIVQITRELLEDSAINIADMMGSLLGERIARIQNAHFTTGTGSSQPSGFVVGITPSETASNSAGLTGDDIINLQHDLDPAYRMNARFMMNDTTLAEVRKITVTNQGYIWQPSFQLGDPDRILGHPVHINQQMDAWDGSTVSLEIIAFGDFSKYKIVDARGLRMRRLVELYAADDREGFVAIMRSGGDLLDAGTDPMVIMSTAA